MADVDGLPPGTARGTAIQFRLRRVAAFAAAEYPVRAFLLRTAERPLAQHRSNQKCHARPFRGVAGQFATAFRARSYGGRAYANALAREGYVVLVHDTFLWGSRRFPPETMPEQIRTLVAASRSIWATDDEAARVMALAFYALLDAGQSLAQAYRGAVLVVKRGASGKVLPARLSTPRLGRAESAVAN